MTKKQTSSRISTLASKYLRMSNGEMRELMLTEHMGDSDGFCADIRSMAASLLSQDEITSQK